MSHIIEFYVEGLAGKEKGYGQAMNRDVNVFFGQNGSGKTSLLKILHSALLSDASNLGNVPFSKAEVSIESVYYKKRFLYSIDRKDKDVAQKQGTLFKKEELSGAVDLAQELLAFPSRSLRAHLGSGLRWSIEAERNSSCLRIASISGQRENSVA